MCDQTRNPIHCVLSPYMTETLKDDQDQDNQRWVAELEKVMQEYRQARQHNRPSATASALVGATEQAVGKKWGIYHYQQANLFRLEGERAQNDEDVDAVYDFAATVHHFLHSVFGLDSMDGAGMPVHAFVRWQPPSGILYPNASWLPHGDKQGIMIFGEGDEKYFTPFSRDLTIFAHEYAHGLIQYHGGLHYTGEAGALNESFADVFATLVLQHSLDQTIHEASWLIGEKILKRDTKGTSKKMGLRSLLAPGTAYLHPRFGHDPQPWHYKWYDPNESVHYNSGIPNHAFYLLAYRIGGRSWEKAGRIWVETLLSLKEDPKPDLTIREWAIRTIKTAMRLRKSFPQEFNRRIVPYTYAAWDSVGLKIRPAEVRG